MSIFQYGGIKYDTVSKQFTVAFSFKEYLKFDAINGVYQIGDLSSTANGTKFVVDDSNLVSYFVNKAGFSKGNDVASATDITLGDDGNYFQISGTTNISTIELGTWRNGMRIVLYFQGALSVLHNTGAGGTKIPFFLAGSASAVTVAGSRFEFILDTSLGSNGAWLEISRTYP